MKHSIFLFLLFFAFSTSDDLKIVMQPGIQLREISNNSNEISKYERFDLPNEASSSSNVGSSEKSYLGIPDSGILELGIAPQRTNTPNTFELHRMDTHNTYIILEINRHFKFSIYYWVGAQSSEEKRKNVAYLAGYMFMKIHQEMPEINIKHFYREAEGVESKPFLAMFNISYASSNHWMYRVAGTKGQFIVQVPLTPNQLNGSDSFVLHTSDSIFIWNSFHSNPFIRSKAIIFGTHTIQMRHKNTQRKMKSPIWITEGFTDRESDFYKYFKHEFFKNMNANAEEKKFPHTPYYYTDKDLENKRREDVKLYTFSNIIHDFTPYEVAYKNLKLKDLNPEVAYVLADLICGNTFVIIGRRNSVISVQKSLAFAETHSRSMEVEYARQRATIIRFDKNLPIHFQIYFSDSSSSEKLQLYKE